MWTRRQVVAGAAACLVAEPAWAADELAALETRSGGRLGIAAMDPASGRRLDLHPDDRFAMCSTFKVALAAAVLARVDRGELALTEAIPIRSTDVVPYAPVTGEHVGGTLTLEQLCEAAVTLSDNVAANLLLQRIGGPEGWTSFVRGLGDATSRLDRVETDLNANTAGDPRDTTTPLAMLGTLRSVLLGPGGTAASRERLAGWMVGCKTGDKRLRAGLPSGWRVGDKTGTGNGAVNDLAIAWPPGRGPILAAAYIDHPGGDDAASSAILAEVGRIVAAHLAG